MQEIEILVGCKLIEIKRSTHRATSPAELAHFLEPKTFRITPAIRLLSDIAVCSIRGKSRRDAVSTAPRTGKSELLSVWTPIWALYENKDMSIALICYGDELAQKASYTARKKIAMYTKYLGYAIATDKSAVGRWILRGHNGGMLAAGINSGVTGHGADLMIIDDPVKDQVQADSKAFQERIYKEFCSTLVTRVHPGGSIFIIQTRWHEKDLMGQVLENNPEDWRHTNIPAISEEGIPDALNRPPGVAMVSALGYTIDDYQDFKKTVGQRTWYALYMGVPRPPEGGIIKKFWLDDNRLACAPAKTIRTIVGVDPSDSGSGDACGLVALSLMQDGRIAIIADWSAPMTSDKWARQSIKLAEEVGASEIAVESFAARETYQRVVKDALKREKVERPIKISAWPPKGKSRVGDDIARSAGLLQGLEVGTVCIAGELPSLEEGMTSWQLGQHQPDGVAACVVAFETLVASKGMGFGLSKVPSRLPGNVIFDRKIA